MKITKWFSENVTFGRKYLTTSQRQLTNLIKEIQRNQSYTYWWDKTLHCQERGVSDERLCPEEVVVSLTTHGNRIYNVHLAIESIMQQTVRPNRIVLWLSEEEFKGRTLPVALQRQVDRGLEICFHEDLRSYTKLIPSLKRFPESCIITIDDDHAYNPDLVEKLVMAHGDHPSDICASRIHQIVLDGQGRPVPYNDWMYCVARCPDENNLAFFTGAGGVLYPPHCFSKEVFNQEVFLNLCGKADDVWFNAMRLRDGIRVTQVFSPNRKGDMVELLASQVTPLWKTNRVHHGNDPAIAAVYGRYDLFEKLK